MKLKSPLPIGNQTFTEFKNINNKKYTIMKKFTFLSLAVFALLTLTSCEAIGTIFKAGMWWGFILVAAVIGLILWLLSRGKN